MDELSPFAGRIHRMFNGPALSGKRTVDVETVSAEGLGDVEDFPPLEEVDGTADEASKMEEVDRSEACVRRKYRLARIHTPTG